MSDVEDAQPRKSSRMASMMEHMQAEVTTSWTDLVLLLCTFLTGLLDSAVFNVWSCFVSMQTGNTIYVGLGVSGQPKDQPWRWAKSGMAIISFIVGSYLFSRMMRMMGPMKRSSIVLSFFLQGVLCFISAALITTGIVPEKAGSMLPDTFVVLIPLALLSISSGGQIVVSRFLGFGELTSIVLTSAYCDFAYDEKLFTSGLSENSKRNRRAASAVMIIAGAIAGGFMTRNDDIELAIWIAGAIKMLVAAIFLFWRSEGGIRLE